MTARGQHGTVVVETMFAFIPILMLFLGIVQYALLAAGQLVVHHAAVAGVRSAAVVLDDDPTHYGQAERLSIGGGTGEASSGGLEELAARILGAAPGQAPARAELALQAVITGPRMAPIRNAVYAKLAAIVPARALALLDGSRDQSVLDVLGSSPVLRLTQAPPYLPVTTAITFPRSPGSPELFDARVDPQGMLTVRVTHAVACTIPLVSALMCGALEHHEGDELALAPAAALQPLLEAAGVRMKVLQAEASMPLQKAPYPYTQPSDGSAVP